MIAAALITALMATPLTACGAEVVHARSAAPVAASDPGAPDQCISPIDVFDTGELLRPEQVMPNAADTGASQQNAMYIISPNDCGSTGYTRPQCDNDFPWTGPADDDIGAILGPIGVTSLVTSTINYDAPAASVTETILRLTGDADSILVTFASECGPYVEIQGDTYAADLGKGVIQMLHIQDYAAVGIEFDDTGLNESQRLDVLGAAVAQLSPA